MKKVNVHAICTSKNTHRVLIGGSSTHKTSAGSIGRFVRGFSKARGAVQTLYVPDRTVPEGSQLKTVPGRCHYVFNDPLKRRTGAVKFKV